MLTGKNFYSASFCHVISIHCILKDKINWKPKRRPIIITRLNRARASHDGIEFQLGCRFPFRRQRLNPRSGVKIQRQERVRSDMLQAPQHCRVRGKPLKLVNKRSPMRWPTNKHAPSQRKPKQIQFSRYFCHCSLIRISLRISITNSTSILTITSFGVA